jgi:hypothetical protein
MLPPHTVALAWENAGDRERIIPPAGGESKRLSGRECRASALFV